MPYKALNVIPSFEKEKKMAEMAILIPTEARGGCAPPQQASEESLEATGAQFWLPLEASG